MIKFLILALVNASLFAGTLDVISISGDKEVIFKWNNNIKNVSYLFKDNNLDLKFPKTKIDEKWQGKIQIENPHALISNVVCTQPEKETAKCRLTLNGPMEKMSERLFLNEEGLKVRYPRGESASLDLLGEEQKPLVSQTPEVQKTKSGGSLFFQSLVVILFIFGLCAGAFFLLRWMKTQNQKTGSRKFLIESLSYTPIGNTKNGVCLLKVGSEFVLVGVTPQQVTMLSNLPKLQEQYESESRYEKDVFNQAIEEELSKMKGISTEVAQ